jgi:hypothetical protein
VSTDLSQITRDGAIRRCLARAVEAVEVRTEAPLRVLTHFRADAREVFELREEFELGQPGRRFLVSVDRHQRDAIVVDLDEA